MKSRIWFLLILVLIVSISCNKISQETNTRLNVEQIKQQQENKKENQISNIDSKDKVSKTVDNGIEFPLTKNYKLLFEDAEYQYIQKKDILKKTIKDSGQKDPAVPEEHQTLIFKIEKNNGKQIVIYTASELNLNFEFVVSNDKWLYLTADSWIPNSESFPVGIARINRCTNQVDMIATTEAYGLKVLEQKAYFFWHEPGANTEMSGIYQLELDSSTYKKVGGIPRMNARAAYSWGEFKKVEDKKIHFFWVGESPNEEGQYILDTETGVLQKALD